MAGPEPRQQAHAEEIRQRREGGGGGMSEAQITALVAKAVAAEFAKVQIQGSGDVTVSGKFPTLTIATTGGAGGAKTATGTINCDTDPPTITINFH